jgi:hypothetical protein
MGPSTFVPGISPGTNVTPSFVPKAVYWLNAWYKQGFRHGTHGYFSSTAAYRICCAVVVVLVAVCVRVGGGHFKHVSAVPACV